MSTIHLAVQTTLEDTLAQRHTTRLAFALAASLAASNADTRNSPVRARSAEDVVGARIRADGPSDVRQGDVGDRDAIGGRASRRAVLVVLLDDDTVRRDSGESDAGVCDVLHAAGGAGDGLDADTVCGVCDCGVGEDDVRNYQKCQWNSIT